VTRYLLAVDSVHTAAAAADALADVLDADDAVVAVGVATADPDDVRDVDDALNAARVRFAEHSVETDRREGIPDEAILDAVADHGADRVAMGARAGGPDADRPAGGLGGTTAAVLAAAEVPVTVIPSADL
jgi:nucleotide-binding universal stress UspA family protein